MYVCNKNLIESGKAFIAGSEYTGSNTDALLKRGLIKEADSVSQEVKEVIKSKKKGKK